MKRTAINLIISVLLFGSAHAEDMAKKMQEAASVFHTKHNLLSGIKMDKEKKEGQLCIWCHIPNSTYSNLKPPEWNRNLTERFRFSPYGLEQNLSKAETDSGPDIMVRVCLTCHDGINAPNISTFTQTAGVQASVIPENEISQAHGHPIGVKYDPHSKSGEKASLREESYPLQNWIGAHSIKDLISEGVIRCTSCHDPHSPNSNFLRTNNAMSTLCRGCHNK